MTPITKCLFPQLQSLCSRPPRCLWAAWPQQQLSRCLLAVGASPAQCPGPSPVTRSTRGGPRTEEKGGGKRGGGYQPHPKWMCKIYLETTETTVHCWFWPLWVQRALCYCTICPLHNVWSEWGQRERESSQAGYRIVSLAMATKTRAGLVTINSDTWEKNRSTTYLLFTQNLFAPWLFFPFSPLDSLIRSPLVCPFS